jgi:Ca2+-binding RTX toxin-like protein
VAGAAFGQGAIYVLNGGSSGITGSGSKRITRGDSTGIEGPAVAGDSFGIGLAITRANADSFDDLIVSAPGDGGNQGSLWVLKGSSSGVVGTGHVRFRQGISPIPHGLNATGPFAFNKFALAVGGTSDGVVAAGTPNEPLVPLATAPGTPALIDSGIVQFIQFNDNIELAVELFATSQGNVVPAVGEVVQELFTEKPADRNWAEFLADESAAGYFEAPYYEPHQGDIFGADVTRARPGFRRPRAKLRSDLGRSTHNSNLLQNSTALGKGPVAPVCGLPMSGATLDTCTPGPQSLTVGIDDSHCHGELIRFKGKAVTPAVPVSAGSLSLAAGQAVIRWTNDVDGTTFEQTVTVNQTLGAAACCSSLQTLINGTNAANSIVPTVDKPYCVYAKDGNDFVQTKSGADLIFAGPDTSAVPNFVDAGSGFDRVIGGPGADHLTGGNGSTLNVIGAAGADYIHALTAKSAELYGGADADSIYGSPGNDVIMPGTGADYVSAGAGNDIVFVYAACEAIAGENLDGGSGTDTLVIPVPRAQLPITITGFENIIVDASRRYLSECF